MGKINHSIRQLWHKLNRQWLPLILGGLSLLGMLSWAEKWYAEQKTHDVAIDIHDRADFNLVEARQIKELLNAHLPASIAQYTLSQLPIGEIEALLERQAFIANAEIFIQMDGEVNVKIDQRTPLVRIINNHQESFYLDQDGDRMPFSAAYKKPMITATGHIQATQTDSLKPAKAKNLKAIYRVSQRIKRDSFLQALTGQLYVTKNQDIHLIPRIGDQTIILGQARDLRDRFAKLKAFYRKVLPHEGWYTYQEINLKYDKQIVAKK
jgi:cell division protein FtsQ